MSEHGVCGHVGDFALWAELRTNAKAFSPNNIKVLFLTPDQCNPLQYQIQERM